MYLNHFRRAGDNSLVTELLQLARDGAKDAPRAWLFGVFAGTLDNHHRIVVKAHVRAVLAAEGLPLAHHHALEHVLLFDLLAWLRGLDRKNNHLADLRVALFGRAGNFKNPADFCAGV